MFQDNNKQFFDAVICQSIGREVQIQSIDLVTGGCINQTICLKTDIGQFFLKWNEQQALDMFRQEAKGLDLLRDHCKMTIPQVIGLGEFEDKAYLLLSYIESCPEKPDYWEEFGQQLAEVHRISQPNFGLSFNNYIGSLPQNNESDKTWLTFFIEKRLRVQFGLAYYNGLIDKSYLKKLDLLQKRLEGFFPEEVPALLHGDLWSGNTMTDKHGKPALVDPAVYFGHREMELAFTKLFGGFPESFYSSYHEAYPLAPNFEERKDLYNCYPLMVHVNLFGTSYLSGIDRVFNYFL